jgi:hypothetical protein
MDQAAKVGIRTAIPLISGMITFYGGPYMAESEPRSRRSRADCDRTRRPNPASVGPLVPTSDRRINTYTSGL